MSKFPIILLFLLVITQQSDCFSIISNKPLSLFSLPLISKHVPKAKNIPQNILNYPRRTVQLKSTHDKREPSKLNNDSNLKTFSSAGSLILLDALLQRSFKAMAIQFPSSLAGCTTLFTFMLLLHSFKNEWGDYVHGLFNPGAILFAKWLPVFFVPSLVTLPLAPSLGSSHELFKVSMVLIGGFMFSLFTTAYSVILIRNFTGSKPLIEPGNARNELSTSTMTSSKPFSREMLMLFSSISVSSLILSIMTGKVDALNIMQCPLQTISMLFATLATFIFGARLPKSVTKLLHPVVTCTTLMLFVSQFVGVITRRSFLTMIASYRTRTLAPLQAGAGDILLYLLGPSVIALACQMYSRKNLIRQNSAQVGTAVFVSSVGGLFSSALLARFIQIHNPIVRLSTLSRNVTSPLAIAIAGIVGANASLAVSMVVISGLIGANFGAAILDMAGIKDAVEVSSAHDLSYLDERNWLLSILLGLGIGAAAHGLGTAAFSDEKEAFPFAAISMALTATGATVLASIPIVKKTLLKVALGV